MLNGQLNALVSARCVLPPIDVRSLLCLQGSVGIVITSCMDVGHGAFASLLITYSLRINISM